MTIPSITRQENINVQYLAAVVAPRLIQTSEHFRWFPHYKVDGAPGHSCRSFRELLISSRTASPRLIKRTCSPAWPCCRKNSTDFLTFELGMDDFLDYFCKGGHGDHREMLASVTEYRVKSKALIDDRRSCTRAPRCFTIRRCGVSAL